MEIITIANQKGGVGKSTTAHALGAGLLRLDYRVLFIDLDSQMNLSYSMQADQKGATAYEVLTEKVAAADAIQHLEQGDIIAGCPLLSGADMELNRTGKEYRLKEALLPLQEKYDYIVIDTPPALGILTVNALTASNSVIIAAMADIFSLQGIGQLYSTVEVVKKYCNAGLLIKGVLLTRHSARSILSRDLTEMITGTAEQFHTFVYQTVIRECISLKEAQASQQDIFSYAPKSNAALDYTSFVQEFLEGSRKA